MKHFYKVDFKHLIEDEDKNGKITQRNQSGTILVLASSCAEAEQVANNRMGSLLDFTVKTISETTIQLVTNGKDINLEIVE